MSDDKDFQFSEHIFVGLLTGISAYDEVQAPSYSRMIVGPLIEENDTKYNREKIQFPKPTSDWGRITHVGFYKLKTGGLLEGTTPLLIPKRVGKGDLAPSFEPGNLTLLLQRPRLP